MTNELVKGYLGKKVAVYGDNVNVSGVITTIEDNWMSIELKNGTERLINLDYVYRIDLAKEK